MEKQFAQMLKDQQTWAQQLLEQQQDFFSTDASSFGLGAVISHVYPDGSERPIAHASKTLNAHQKNYSQIEKGALAIFGVKKFHEYLYGRKFTLITDHKPLVSIFNPQKSIPIHFANRIQRWALFLSNYNFDIKYKSTNNHQNADALSRLPLESDTEIDIELDNMDINLAEEICSFPVDATQIADCTKKDKLLSQVLKFIKEGWPEQVDDILKPYFNRRENLTTLDGVILLQIDSHRVVIPKCFQTKILNLLHEGHWGIVKTKQLARRYCWWPGIDKAIENLILKCSRCSSVLSMPTKEFSSWTKPSKPWQRIHLDFAGPFKNSSWFICVDGFSHYPYVFKMNSTTTSATINTLKNIFAIEGLPEVIVSDNGPQFTAEEFRLFCNSNGVIHLTTAPFHPASNGQAERFVRSFKTSLKKNIESGKYIDESLLSFLSTYRSTPMENDKSPAEILHGRQPRIMLSLLNPCERISNENRISKFKINDNVVARLYGKPKRWVDARILKVLGNMLYLLRTTDDKTIKRHQNQIRKSVPTGSDFNRAHELANLLPPHNNAEPSVVSDQPAGHNNYNRKGQSQITFSDQTNSAASSEPRSLQQPIVRRSMRIRKLAANNSSAVNTKLTRRN